MKGLQKHQKIGLWIIAAGTIPALINFYIASNTRVEESFWDKLVSTFDTSHDFFFDATPETAALRGGLMAAAAAIMFAGFIMLSLTRRPMLKIVSILAGLSLAVTQILFIDLSFWGVGDEVSGNLFAEIILLRPDGYDGRAFLLIRVLPFTAAVMVLLILTLYKSTFKLGRWGGMVSAVAMLVQVAYFHYIDLADSQKFGAEPDKIAAATNYQVANALAPFFRIAVWAGLGGLMLFCVFTVLKKERDKEKKKLFGII